MKEDRNKAVEKLYDKLLKDAKAAGYNLNPDVEFTKSLVAGLYDNELRYGYQACPCRLAGGKKDEDLDIVCPCDYRDQDIAEYGACYCALYVSPEIARGEKQAQSIPERRPPGGPLAHKKAVQKEGHVEDYEQVKVAGLPYPVWRCKVCGYLCARPQPPDICPICKVTKERFERFM